jgi:hypothetical protein
VVFRDTGVYRFVAVGSRDKKYNCPTVAVVTVVAMPLPPSAMISDRWTSMIEPVGAITVNNVVELLVCQNDANDWAGGEQSTCAGVATDTVVSEYSRSGELLNPTHSTEQVAVEPCAAGGVNISTLLTLTLLHRLATVELVTVPILPAAPIRLFGVIAVPVPLVETKRNIWRSSTLLLNCRGVLRLTLEV